jgi:antitoxin VapB
MTRAEEVANKMTRVQELLKREKLDGLLLSKRGNFAWLAAGGNSHVVSAMEPGIASLLVTRKEKFLLTDNIELPRLQAEEMEELGFTPVVVNWWEGGLDAALHKKTAKMKLGADIPLEKARPMESEIARLRWSLLPSEVERYRKLGADCARAMGETCQTLRPGMTEFQVGADIAGRLQARGIEPHVLLIAADDRIRLFRHPIPTENKVKKCCMVVICGERRGLILSMTRLVHFGPLPEDLKKRHQAVVEVDAAAIAAARPGSTAGKVFAAIKQAYAAAGFPDEWQYHHQGGAMGYAARDWKAHREDDPTPIVENQALGWNPSIAGTKSEDTIIAASSGAEILSPIPDWPMITLQTNIGPIPRPDILVQN